MENQKQSAGRRKKVMKVLLRLLIIIAVWAALSTAITLIFGKHETEEIKIAIAAERYTFFNISVSETVIASWVIIAIVAVAAVVVRFTALRKMNEKPSKLQNILEIIVENISKYTDSKVGNLGFNIGAYIFTVCVFMICSAFVELFGVRPPTADITVTFAFAIITFLLINYYGFKIKGVGGRIKAIGKPVPFLAPIKIVTDLAIPISLSCRLFGNMLGGMIVIDLLYVALGNAAVGITSVFGLYFNVFHPLIQIFIFVTLSLSFINELTETSHE